MHFLYKVVEIMKLHKLFSYQQKWKRKKNLTVNSQTLQNQALFLSQGSISLEIASHDIQNE